MSEDAKGSMDDDQVILVLENYRKDAFGPDSMGLTSERTFALDRYNGEPYGDEEDGYSKFVTKDLAEAVDWSLGPVLRPFIQTGELAEFRPRNKDDETQAKEESEFVSYVIMQENSGFILFHDCFKDGMILKNCYAKHWWDEEDTVEEKWYENVPVLEIGVIKKAIPDMEIVEQEEVEGQEDVYNIKIRIKTKKNRVKITSVPPEELRIANTTRGTLQESDFVEHIPHMTRSALIKLGMPKDWIMKQPAKGQKQNTDSETQARNTVNDEDHSAASIIDKANEEMDFAEAYVRIDYDQDGITELRRIYTVNRLIVPGADWNQVVTSIPFTGGVPKRMPHRHIGESYQDGIGDLADQSTAMTRQLFDNVYNTTHNQWAINDRVEEEDVLEPGAAAIFRVSGKEPIGDSIAAIRPEPIAGHLLPVISFLDERKRKRLGIDDGDIDPNILKQTTEGAFLADLNRKNQQTEMTIRMYAETFVKELVVQVRELLIENQKEPREVKLGGKFVTVNPRFWQPRDEVTVKVGLGTGTQDERLRVLQSVSGQQERLAPFGIVTAQEAYNLYVDTLKELGRQNPEKYAINPDPKNPEYQEVLKKQEEAKQGQSNPLAEAEDVKGKYKLQSEQQKARYDAQEAENQRRFDAAFKQQDVQNKQMLDELKENKTHIHQMHALMADMKKHNDALRSNENIAILDGEVQLAKEGMKVDIGKPGMGAELSE